MIKLLYCSCLYVQSCDLNVRFINETIVNVRLCTWQRASTIIQDMTQLLRLQYKAADTLACAQQRNDATCGNGIDMPVYGPLCANIKSSIIPGENQDTPIANMRKKFGEDRMFSSGICSQINTDRHALTSYTL